MICKNKLFELPMAELVVSQYRVAILKAVHETVCKTNGSAADLRIEWLEWLIWLQMLAYLRS